MSKARASGTQPGLAHWCLLEARYATVAGFNFTEAARFWPAKRARTESEISGSYPHSKCEASFCQRVRGKWAVPRGANWGFQREKPGNEPGLPYITEQKEVREMFLTAVLKIVLNFFGTLEARLRIRWI